MHFIHQNHAANKAHKRHNFAVCEPLDFRYYSFASYDQTEGIKGMLSIFEHSHLQDGSLNNMDLNHYRLKPVGSICG
jgi:hypothetical protein